jgi:DNA modification methylase
MNIDLRLGDCIEILKTLEDNSVDSIVTDPPYHLTSIVKRFGKEGSAPAQYGTDGAFARASKGFMGKEWDGGDIAFRTDVWSECYRVLKPGGHLLSFGGSRTYHRMAVAIEDAGFEVRDQIMWIYASGFPKSHNIGKAIDKMGIDNEWEGWGTALKPAHEPICMARKPLSEKSIAENVLKHGTGGINIDGCRIPFDMTDTNPATNPLYRQENNYKMPEPGQESNGAVSFTSSKNEISQEGRFPANIMFDEEAGKILDEQSGISKSTGSVRKKDTETDPSNMDFKHKEGENSNPYAGQSGGASRFFYCPKVSKKERNAGMNGSIEIFTPTIKLVYLLEKNVWEKEDLETELADTDKSLQKVIDEYIIMEDNKWNIGSFGNYIMEQFLKEDKSITETEINSTTILETLNSWIQNHTRTYIAELFGEMVKDIKFVEDANKKSTTLNIILQKKDGYSQSVKNVELKGLWSININQSKSSHPTVKPIKLMEYLIKLVTPKGGTVLEPFMGSGSTGIAAKNLGMSFIGIEKEEEYFEIAKQRINGKQE